MASLVERLRAQREFWVPLDEAKPQGLRVRLIRPQETGMHKLLLGLDAAKLAEHTTGWDGFSEADLIGAALGSSDPLPFDAGAWAEVLADRADWFAVLAKAMQDAIVKHLEARDAASKN